MKEDLITRAMESADPILAEKAFREIDTQIQSITDSKEKANILLRKAVLYGVLGRIADARIQIDVALREAPNDAVTRLQHDYLDGSLYHQEEKIGEAFARLTIVLLNHANLLGQPDFRFVYEDIQQHRGFELFRLRRFQDAIPILEECLTFEMKREDRSIALANLGISHSVLKNREAARDYLLKALDGDLKGWAGQVHFHLGLTYAHLKQLVEAKREFKICEREQYVPIAKVYAWLARICDLLGEKSEAEHYARLARPV